ncbi:YehR family protein [Miniphocaeibacter massiliensis]|uniref:YehR family protein n=1 Tax=Miniphocaeibacter massiliensis TaxID=2041841 RepID=UPI000C1BC389|nr:YehR family protein [Miniphocaeibacter massiliensis]
MKKIAKIMILLTLSLLLVSCNKAKKLEETTYTNDINGVKTKLTFYHYGDKVEKQTATNEWAYSAMGLATKEEAEQALSELVEQYQGVEGITHKMDYQEDKVFESLEVNYKKLDFDKAKNIPGIMLKGDFKNGVSLKKTAEIIEKQGFKKEE